MPGHCRLRVADTPNQSLPMTDTPPPGAPAPPCLFTLANVAEITALSPSTLRREIRLKRLAVHRFGTTGSALRVAEDDLAAWLARHRRAAGEALPRKHQHSRAFGPVRE